MDNLQIIARILGWEIRKRGNKYYLIRGCRSYRAVYENLHQVSIHLAKQMDETLKAYRSLDAVVKMSDFDKSKLSRWENFEIETLQCRASS